MSQHPSVDRLRIRLVPRLIPKHANVHIAQGDVVVRVVNIDADIERPDL